MLMSFVESKMEDLSTNQDTQVLSCTEVLAGSLCFFNTANNTGRAEVRGYCVFCVALNSVPRFSPLRRARLCCTLLKLHTQVGPHVYLEKNYCKSVLLVRLGTESSTLLVITRLDRRLSWEMYSLVSHTLRRERKGLVTLQLPSCC